MKKLLLILSIVFSSIASFGQNTASLPYWPLLLKQSTIANNDSVLVYNHTTMKYQKMAWVDLNLLTATSLTANAPILFNPTTKVIDVQQASHTTNGVITSAMYDSWYGKVDSTSTSVFIRRDGGSSPTTGTIKIGLGQTVAASDNSSSTTYAPNLLILASNAEIQSRSTTGLYSHFSTINKKAIFNFENLANNETIKFKSTTGGIDTVAYLSDLSAVGGSSVPSSRTLTINGTTYDLSANRSWTVGGGAVSSLTTIGSSGASTLSSGVLNVPNYTLAGLGGQPINIVNNITSSSSFALTQAGITIVYNGSAATTATLPLLSSSGTGLIIFKNISAFNLVINRSGSDTIYDTATITTTTLYPGQSLILQNATSTWIIL
jgi:hypothetical protein